MRRIPVAVILLLASFGCSGERREAPAPPPRSEPGTPTGGVAAEREPARPGAADSFRTTGSRNSPPEIRGVRFIGGDGRPGNTLGVEAEGYDADGDRVQFEIAWWKNGQPAGDGNRLAAPVKRGDKVRMTITPFDGKDRGNPVTLTREILNTPPAIEGQEQFRIDGNTVTFHVRATDADGDPLQYSLKDGPPGMVIDRKTAVVTWVSPPGTTGKFPFTVVVSDGAGGETTARFTVTIAEQPSSEAR